MRGLRELREDRALRNAAKGAFDAHVDQVKADLAARGIGGRIADTATGKVKAAANQALEIADENREIVAGTLAALVLWFARKPIGHVTSRLFGRGSGPED